MGNDTAKIHAPATGAFNFLDKIFLDGDVQPGQGENVVLESGTADAATAALTKKRPAVEQQANQASATVSPETDALAQPTDDKKLLGQKGQQGTTTLQQPALPKLKAKRAQPQQAVNHNRQPVASDYLAENKAILAQIGRPEGTIATMKNNQIGGDIVRLQRDLGVNADGRSGHLTTGHLSHYVAAAEAQGVAPEKLEAFIAQNAGLYIGPENADNRGIDFAVQNRNILRRIGVNPEGLNDQQVTAEIIKLQSFVGIADGDGKAGVNTVRQMFAKSQEKGKGWELPGIWKIPQSDAPIKAPGTDDQVDTTANNNDGDDDIGLGGLSGNTSPVINDDDSLDSNNSSLTRTDTASEGTFGSRWGTPVLGSLTPEAVIDRLNRLDDQAGRDADSDNVAGAAADLGAYLAQHIEGQRAVDGFTPATHGEAISFLENLAGQAPDRADFAGAAAAQVINAVTANPDSDMDLDDYLVALTESALWDNPAFTSGFAQTVIDQPETAENLERSLLSGIWDNETTFLQMAGVVLAATEQGDRDAGSDSSGNRAALRQKMAAKIATTLDEVYTEGDTAAAVIAVAALTSPVWMPGAMAAGTAFGATVSAAAGAGYAAGSGVVSGTAIGAWGAAKALPAATMAAGSAAGKATVAAFGAKVSTVGATAVLSGGTGVSAQSATSTTLVRNALTGGLKRTVADGGNTGLLAAGLGTLSSTFGWNREENAVKAALGQLAEYQPELAAEVVGQTMAQLSWNNRDDFFADVMALGTQNDDFAVALATGHAPGSTQTHFETIEKVIFSDGVKFTATPSEYKNFTALAARIFAGSDDADLRRKVAGQLSFQLAGYGGTGGDDNFAQAIAAAFHSAGQLDALLEAEPDFAKELPKTILSGFWDTKPYSEAARQVQEAAARVAAGDDSDE